MSEAEKGKPNQNDAVLDEGQESTTVATLDSAQSSVTSAATEPADGELFQLLQSNEEDSAPLTQTVVAALRRELSREIAEHHIATQSLDGSDRIHSSLTTDAFYGNPLTAEEAAELMPSGDEGLIFDATIIPDVYFVDGKLKRGLDHRDFDPEKSSKIKPRRPSLPVTASDFFSSLTKIDGPARGQSRYIFHGVLNGWPQLRTFELISLAHRRDSPALPKSIELLTGQILWMKSWHCNEEGKRGVDPKVLSQRPYLARLRGAPWTAKGWSKDSPGFCFWYESHRSKVSYGTNMLTSIGDDAQCTYLHMLAHRYAVQRETPRNRLTYHSIVVLEWDHKRYLTVVEAAYLNGIGGYKGQSNWFDDRDAPIPALYKALPPEMIGPWKNNMAEVRCYDVPIHSFNEFKMFVAKYEKGPDKRFVDPHYTFSHPARLTFRSKRHIAQYLLNYISRDGFYDELSRNCQTFTADFASFLAGKKGIVPFHPVNRIDYQNRTHLFLYDWQMYENSSKKKKKQIQM